MVAVAAGPAVGIAVPTAAKVAVAMAAGVAVKDPAVTAAAITAGIAEVVAAAVAARKAVPLAVILALVQRVEGFVAIIAVPIAEILAVVQQVEGVAARQAVSMAVILAAVLTSAARVKEAGKWAVVRVREAFGRVKEGVKRLAVRSAQEAPEGRAVGKVMNGNEGGTEGLAMMNTVKDRLENTAPARVALAVSRVSAARGSVTLFEPLTRSYPEIAA